MVTGSGGALGMVSAWFWDGLGMIGGWFGGDRPILLGDCWSNPGNVTGSGSLATGQNPSDCLKDAWESRTANSRLERVKPAHAENPSARLASG